jgi:hypothetical protein
MQPPTVHLEAGVHRGLLRLDSAQRVIGEPGAIVLGGIVVTADDVTVRDVIVVGGEYGIEVDGTEDVALEDVSVSGSRLDGIHVRRSTVAIRGCTVASLRSRYAQAIDISFAFDLDPSLVEDCTVTGGLEGTVSHSARLHVRRNRVSRTLLRANRGDRDVDGHGRG